MCLGGPEAGRGGRSVFPMATPLLAGLSVAAAALTARYAVVAAAGLAARVSSAGGGSAGVMSAFMGRSFFVGGFEAEMTRREAAKILAVRENAAPDKIKEAHRRIMVANHPDAGGSPYLATKVNEAKEMLLGKKRGDTAL